MSSTERFGSFSKELKKNLHIALTKGQVGKVPLVSLIVEIL
jgi:hypothetical protein